MIFENNKRIGFPVVWCRSGMIGIGTNLTASFSQNLYVASGKILGNVYLVCLLFGRNES